MRKSLYWGVMSIVPYVAALMCLPGCEALFKDPDPSRYEVFQEDTVDDSKGHDDIAPDNDVVPSRDDVVPSEDDVVPSEDDVVPPDEDVAPPDDDIVTPDEDIVPSEDDVVPSDDDVIPSDEDVVPPSDNTPPPGPCIPTLSTAVFDHSLCVCDDFEMKGNTWMMGAGIADFFVGLFTGGSKGKSHVGVNGSLLAAGNVMVDGHLDVAGDLETKANFMVGRGLQVGQTFSSTGNTNIGENAYIGGGLKGYGFFSAGGTISIDLLSLYLGVILTPHPITKQLYDPHPPCRCTPAQGGIDVAQEVATHRHETPLLLPNGAGHSVVWLEPGVYYTNDSSVFKGNLVFASKGNVTIYVENDIDLIGNGVFVVPENRELNIYVSGGVSSIGNLMSMNSDIFDPLAVGQLRLYIGGAGNVDFDLKGNLLFKGGIYAPNANLTSKGNIMIQGSLVTRNFDQKGNIMFMNGPVLKYENCDQPPKDPEPNHDYDDDPVTVI